MLGYVTADKPELKIKEYEIYKGYYCGVCKSVGARYGQLPRMALSYDFAFLALLLGALEDVDEEIEYEHCLVHHIKKKSGGSFKLGGGLCGGYDGITGVLQFFR